MECDWETHPGQPTKKVFLEQLCDEEPAVLADKKAMNQAPAICWSYGRTLGNIAVFSQSVLGEFPAKSGIDAVLPCDFVNAGKFRNGTNDGGVELIKLIGGRSLTTPLLKLSAG